MKMPVILNRKQSSLLSGVIHVPSDVGSISSSQLQVRIIRMVSW